MTFRELLSRYRLSQRGAAELLGIPLRSVENWCTGTRTPPPYLIPLLDAVLTLMPGEKPHVWPHRWFCDSCGLFFGSDAPHRQPDGNYSSIACPCCGSWDTWPDTPEEAAASVQRLTEEEARQQLFDDE